MPSRARARGTSVECAGPLRVPPGHELPQPLEAAQPFGQAHDAGDAARQALLVFGRDGSLFVELDQGPRTQRVRNCRSVGVLASPRKGAQPVGSPARTTLYVSPTARTSSSPPRSLSKKTIGAVVSDQVLIEKGEKHR